MNAPTLSIPHLSDAPSARGGVSLLGGADGAELDDLLPGGVYALVPQSPPSRFPLWVNLLRGAIGQGRTAHVMLRAEPEDFLHRLEASGWSEARHAWTAGNLGLYRMADGFSKLLFRMDVGALTKELGYWGVDAQSLLLVDAGDELLSLHDLSLATSQLIKLKAWARTASVPVLLNFTQVGSSGGVGSLNGLMDHFSGMARLQSDAVGPTLTLDYWQSSLGTAAGRTLGLAVESDGYRLRPLASAASGDRRRTVDTPSASAAPDADSVTWSEGYTLDQVWARELQMLTGQPWKHVSSVAELMAQAGVAAAPLAVLGYGPDTDLAELARSVHAVRLKLPGRGHLVVAEHRVSLRYANELMLLKLGADAVIRQDLPLDRWPVVLKGLKTPAQRKMPDLDVQTALASASTSQGRGYLPVSDFLNEVRLALQRGQLLGVPIALAVLKPLRTTALADAVELARFRRAGDFITTDGEKLYVFFNACSLTRGQEVLDGTFQGRLFEVVSSMDWMASEIDIDNLLQTLAKRQAAHPFELARPETTQQAPLPGQALADEQSHEPLVSAADSVTTAVADFGAVVEPLTPAAALPWAAPPALHGRLPQQLPAEEDDALAPVGSLVEHVHRVDVVAPEAQHAHRVQLSAMGIPPAAELLTSQTPRPPKIREPMAAPKPPLAVSADPVLLAEPDLAVLPVVPALPLQAAPALSPSPSTSAAGTLAGWAASARRRLVQATEGSSAPAGAQLRGVEPVLRSLAPVEPLPPVVPLVHVDRNQPARAIVQPPQPSQPVPAPTIRVVPAEPAVRAAPPPPAVVAEPPPTPVKKVAQRVSGVQPHVPPAATLLPPNGARTVREFGAPSAAESLGSQPTAAEGGKSLRRLATAPDTKPAAPGRQTGTRQ